MEKIKIRLRRTEDPGIFHDSRKDARELAKAINILIDKVNELIDETEKLKKQISANPQT